MPSRPVVATGFAAFAAGWGLMSLEILNGRLMAPAFGQTIYQWGALIGTALAFMSLGYWMGGRLGAGRRAGAALPLLFLVAAASAALTPWIGRGLAAAAASSFGSLVGAIVTAAILLGLPALVLAAVSPLCVARLATHGQVAASASGMVSALGSLGSIGGTFFAAFYAVPYAGLAAGYASAAGIVVVAAIATGMRPWKALWILLPLGLGVVAQRDFAASFVEYVETPYNTVMVSESAETISLSINSPKELQSLLRKDGGPTGMYWDLLAAVPALARGKSVLFLGVAGGSAVAATTKAWPGIRALGVELDPGITRIARQRFGLTIPVVTADARQFIDRGDETFDVIVVDLYATGQIPAYVATREFYAAVARRLAPGGVVALNVFSAGDADAILNPVTATVAAVFPGVLAAAAGNENTIVLAWNQTMSLTKASGMLSVAPASAWLPTVTMIARLAEPDPAALASEALTDDRSDLEIRAAKALDAAAMR